MGDLISIVMATFNGALFLREQIDSILSQTVQDFEVVVCDDCSTDDTWDILNEYASKDKRFRLLRNESNVGFKKSFEKGILLSKGDYIALCDQDDIWFQDHLEVLLDNIGNRMISAGDAELIDEEGTPIGLLLSEVTGWTSSPSCESLRAMRNLFYANQVQGASMLIDRRFLAVALPLPETERYHDEWFSLLSCFYGGLSYTFRVVNKHRRHNNNASRLVNEKANIYYKFILRIKSDRASDKESLLREISKRVTLTKKQKLFLNNARAMLSRNKSKFGRVINGIIQLPFFRLIYDKSPWYFLTLFWRHLLYRIGIFRRYIIYKWIYKK